MPVFSEHYHDTYQELLEEREDDINRGWIVTDIEENDYHAIYTASTGQGRHIKNIYQKGGAQ